MVTRQRQIEDNIEHLAWSPDGRYLVSDEFAAGVNVWDVTNLRRVFIWQGHFDSDSNAVTWSPDARYVASGGFDDVQVWRPGNNGE